jgi:hypothetical protein
MLSLSPDSESPGIAGRRQPPGRPALRRIGFIEVQLEVRRSAWEQPPAPSEHQCSVASAGRSAAEAQAQLKLSESVAAPTRLPLAAGRDPSHSAPSHGPASRRRPNEKFGAKFTTQLARGFDTAPTRTLPGRKLNLNYTS